VGSAVISSEVEGSRSITVGRATECLGFARHHTASTLDSGQAMEFAVCHPTENRVS